MFELGALGRRSARPRRPSGRASPASQALSRLTAPARSPWFWLALWTAAAAASFAALIPVLFDRGPPMPAERRVPLRSRASSFAACGLVAWRRRRDSAVGPMLTIAGFGVLVPAILAQLDSPIAFTLVAAASASCGSRSTPR